MNEFSSIFSWFYWAIVCFVNFVWSKSVELKFWCCQEVLQLEKTVKFWGNFKIISSFMALTIAFFGCSSKSSEIDVVVKQFCDCFGASRAFVCSKHFVICWAIFNFDIDSVQFYFWQHSNFLHSFRSQSSFRKSVYDYCSYCGKLWKEDVKINV
jgi:hypothetical protein